MKSPLIQAFLEIPGSPSPDAVIADPDLNKLFLQNCASMGLSESAESLNRSLLNARKNGALEGLRKSKRTFVRNQEEFKFASEIAARFLERRDQVTLDQIICSPERAAEFDELARQLSPGFSSFDYRWAALGLRKRCKLKPELLARVVQSKTVERKRVTDLILEELPASQGLYVFHERDQALYVGECENLRKRLRKHLDHSDNKGLAHWLWQHGVSDLHLEFHILPDDTTTRIRKALEAELIASRNPTFNVQGT
jgi:site-specific DNA-methyltransferase (adenine-specific)